MQHVKLLLLLVKQRWNSPAAGRGDGPMDALAAKLAEPEPEQLRLRPHAPTPTPPPLLLFSNHLTVLPV